MTTLTIGKVAQWAGLGVETVRFYEREGFIEGTVAYAGMNLIGKGEIDVEGALKSCDRTCSSGSTRPMKSPGTGRDPNNELPSTDASDSKRVCFHTHSGLASLPVLVFPPAATPARSPVRRRESASREPRVPRDGR